MSGHMTQTDRIQIEMGLSAGFSLNQIAKEIQKHPSTVSREIIKHAEVSDKGAPCRIKNRCIHRNNCNVYQLCETKPNCVRKCSTCSSCNSICADYQEEVCAKLSSAPYVCNGCKFESSCVLRKKYYHAKAADAEYRRTLKESREGYNMTTLELRSIDDVVSPLLINGHSIHHIYVHNADKLTVSESTIARLIKDRQLTATVMDQRRVVKLKPRKAKKNEKKIDRKCRMNRTVDDYKRFMAANPQLDAVEMDTVIGKNGGKCILTFIFPKSELMLAFLCNTHTSAAVNYHIENIYSELQSDFTRLFPAIITDNGSEFSDPSRIETAPDGSNRTRVFYCDPMASWQKPYVERNHEFIRYILPKGSSFDNLTQEKLNLVMSHINSYSRESIGDKSPFEMFAFIHGQQMLNKLLRLVCQTVVEPNNIILTPALLR